MRSVFGHGLTWALVWLSTNALAQHYNISNSNTSSNSSVTTGHDATGTLPRHSSSALPSSTRQPTCRSATINYITHSLPKQCLTSTRSSSTHVSSSSSETAQQTSLTAQDTTTSFQTSSESALTAESVFVQPNEQHGNSTILSHTATSHNTSQASSTSTEILASISAVALELPQPTATESEPELETDSPLDNANFLSFDEWKKQNLAKAGQSPDHVGQQSRSSGEKQGRTRPGINNALDVLGEDSEIELDFSGFGGNTRPDETERARDAATRPSPPGQPNTASMSPGLRSKDAGKTCKERSNYASFDCAATVLKTNPECKSTSSILIENKDSYMLNICNSANKFFTVELCDDILIDTIVLANYEFFSSIFRTFRVSVSDRYPVRPDRWKELGVFEARNTREVQAFLIEQPLIWARYLRIEFLTHYGNEYYCPVSLLRVHGTTMMEEFRHEEKTARGESPDDSEVDEAVVPPALGTVLQEPSASSQTADKSVIESLLPLEAPTGSVSHPVVDSTITASRAPANTSILASAEQDSALEQEMRQQTEPSRTSETTAQTNYSTAHVADIAKSTSNSTRPNTTEIPRLTQTHHVELEQAKPSPSSVPSESANASSSSSIITSVADPTANTTSTNSTSVKSFSAESSSTTINTTEPASSSAKSALSSLKPLSSSLEAPKQSTTTTNPNPPNPTTQESFFKSIHKRLQTLESNATLSLQYIEAQSLLLRDAFSKVEKRQIRKTEAFLSHLNETVTHELRGFKREYDELWQGTVIELESQKEMWRAEMLAVSSRLTIVADELVFQKRMVIVQSTLLMLCLGLVLFARSGTAAGGGAATLEFPLLQQMVGKSGSLSFREHVAPRSFYSPPQSPSPPNEHGSPASAGSGADGGGGARPPVRRRQQHGFWRRSAEWTGVASAASATSGNVSDATTHDGTPASLKARTAGVPPDLRFEPPTPGSTQVQGGDENDDVEEVRLNGSQEGIHGIEETGDGGLDRSDVEEGDDVLVDEIAVAVEQEEEEEEVEEDEDEDDKKGIERGEENGTPLRPFETQSSPSTPSGSRDQVKSGEAWPGDVSHEGVPGVSLRFMS